MLRITFVSFFACVTLALASPREQARRQPLVFEPNRGRAPADVAWLARGPAYEIVLTSRGAAILIHGEPEGASRPAYTVVRMRLDGGLPWNRIDGLDSTGGVSNYIYGGNGTH